MPRKKKHETDGTKRKQIVKLNPIISNVKCKRTLNPIKEQRISDWMFLKIQLCADYKRHTL